MKICPRCGKPLSKEESRKLQEKDLKLEIRGNRRILKHLAEAKMRKKMLRLEKSFFEKEIEEQKQNIKELKEKLAKLVEK